MYRKIAFVITIFILFLGIENCNSPEEPEEPAPEYRYGVEVIYTRETVYHKVDQGYVILHYVLKDQPPRQDDLGSFFMENIGGTNKFRGFLPKVFIQTQRYPNKHKIYVLDSTIQDCSYAPAENFDVQGAYDPEIKKIKYSENCYHSYLYFKMSKE